MFNAILFGISNAFVMIFVYRLRQELDKMKAYPSESKIYINGMEVIDGHKK